ncbi:hypothetical protein BVC80_9001g16 [Macleaya cordata]|uniref:Uncharacterized protein n=1 Tax=Macleaya cordata TaxID=56857 RepID=A0A200QM06_MACCD|nr:hypothetical protein BVC80_9001g16 [Macleaya cordata]
MATIAVKLAFIFSLFIISQARSPFNLPANEFQPSIITSSESDTDNKEDATTLQTIRLPSEKSSESDDSPTTTVTTIGVDQPIKITYDISFRPINRHFHHHNMHAKGPFLFRLPHRCRHHHHHGRPMVEKQFTGRQEISYGNDMLMSDKTTFDPMFHGDVGEYHGERFPFVVKSFEVNGGSLTDNLGHVEDEMEERKTEEEGGFVKRFRKFLSNRF